jgi:cellulose synthase/poly-beta-1,6-N-acetylglucosamine synthase-like glycosyltransferase
MSFQSNVCRGLGVAQYYKWIGGTKLIGFDRTHRYLRYIVNTISHWCYRSIAIPSNPSFTSKDVTVIIPTIHNNFEELRESLQSILACQPYELLLVTTGDKYQKLAGFVKTLEVSNIRLFQVPIANKRIQVCEAIPEVKTNFIIMADDDVTWPKTILPWLLAPFEDPKIGGVGPCQRVKRVRSGPMAARCFNWLGAAYIERRNFEISATHGIDGGTSCMSGRTCVFRSEILQSSLFLDGFRTERWGKFQLNADDDNFVTRWLVSNHWKTYIQYDRECEIETTLENNIKFLYQCSRWARSNWRSNYTSLFTERHVWQ